MLPVPMTRYRIAVKGVVQGVGFRPFVKRLADRLELAGIVHNSAGGVTVEFDSEGNDSTSEFLGALRTEAPPLARIDEYRVEQLAGVDLNSPPYRGFTIEPSRPGRGAFTLISPDIASCPDCLREFRDPADRRFRYPFINCTNCGPRYSIILSTPYDRANTTMAPFAMCAACAAEYANPYDRRFHAEPTACPACGPSLSAIPFSADPIQVSLDALGRGEIVAIKGLGGFQLACDALSAQSVTRLRERKRRHRKPFALMMRDLDTVRRFCRLSSAECVLLQGPIAPIVLLKLRENDLLPDAVAPGLDEIGVMLPYTPLHHLLFESSLVCLVMTSGNICEEPIVISNNEARIKLHSSADRLLVHDRDIFMRVDDSVVRCAEGQSRVLRRARGYAPQAIDLGFDRGEVLACGAELKSTLCLTKGNYAILSQHLGDLENVETLRFFEETLQNLKTVWNADPRVIAHDLHPDYMSTRWAQAQPQPRIAVQHHHAHIASCMAENGVRDPVIGVALDGTGYGADGQIWGGEFLICSYSGFERAAHLRYVPLVGGDRASREGWRMAAAHLFDAFGPEYRDLDLTLWKAATPAAWKIFDRLLRKPLMFTSSCGRFFDAVSALAGICLTSSYEGEAAMLLEAAARKDARRDAASYPFALDQTQYPWAIDTRPVIRAIVRECTIELNPPGIARAFHGAIGNMIETVCLHLAEKTGLRKVCLSGGTFQNFTLMADAASRLRLSGFEVFTHSQTPPNDGGISLGQAVIAASIANLQRK